VADHLRTQIREQVVSELTGLATTGSNIFESRVYPMESAGLPGIIIYTTDEVVEADQSSTTSSGRRLVRFLTLKIEGYAKAETDVDDTLDTIAKEIEEKIAGSTIGGLVKDVVLAETEIELTAESEQPVGRLNLTYQIHYETYEGDVDAAA
jgi:hypothetical protein